MYIKVDRQEMKTKRNQKERREEKIEVKKGKKEGRMDRQMDRSNRASKLQLILPGAGWSTC